MAMRWIIGLSFCVLLAHRALNPPPSSSLAEGRTPPLVPPPCGGARFPTLAGRIGPVPTSPALCERFDESSLVCACRVVHSLDELSVPRCSLVLVRTGVLKAGRG